MKGVAVTSHPRTLARTLVCGLAVTLGRSPSIRCRAVGHEPQAGVLRVRIHEAVDGEVTVVNSDYAEFVVALCHRCGRADHDSARTVINTLRPTPEEFSDFERLPW